MTTTEITSSHKLNLSQQKVGIFPFAATGANFWDKERELKECWESNSKRNWSVYMQKGQFTYSWDFREVEHRK